MSQRKGQLSTQLQILGFKCPDCQRDIRVTDAMEAYLEAGSGYQCYCPYCDRPIKSYYGLNIIRRKRVHTNAPPFRLEKQL